VLVLAGWFVGVELESAEARKDGSGEMRRRVHAWPAASRDSHGNSSDNDHSDD